MSIDIVLINDLILDGYNDVESIHLANIIKCQRKIYKEASIRRQLFKEERAVIIKKNKEDIRNNPDGWYQYNRRHRE